MNFVARKGKSLEKGNINELIMLFLNGTGEKLEGKNFEVDEDGFLLSFEQWCPEWVQFVKDSEGIKEISAEHQQVIDFLQDYYRKNGIAPMVRILSKVTGYKEELN